MRLTAIPAAVVASALLSTNYASGQGTSLSDSERIQKLEEAVSRLQVEKDNLQHQLNQLKGMPSFATGTNLAAPTAATGAPGSTNLLNFVLPAGKGTTLKIGGFIQGNAEFGDTGSFSGNFSDNPVGGAAHVPLHNRFRIRRARINMTGDVFKNFDFKLEGDFAQTDGASGGKSVFSGTDLFANWHQFDEANIKAGQFKAPFGWEQTLPDTTIYSIERSLPTGALTPERQVGIQLWGRPLANVAIERTNLLEYAAGIFNGNGRNITVNDDAYFMYVGRINVNAFTGKLFDQPTKFRVGADAMTSRYDKGTRISPSDNLAMDLRDGSLFGFTAPSTAESVGWDLNETFTVGPFDLMAEYLEQNIRPRNSSAFKEFIANGYYVQGAYFLPGNKFQLVAKWSSLNPGQAAEDDVQSMLGGINYYIRGDNLKLMLDYVHTWSEFRHDHSGTGDDQFDEIVLRLQLMF